MDITKRESELVVCIRKLEDDIAKLTHQLQDAHQQLAALRSSFKVGQVIEWGTSPVRRGRIVAVSAHWNRTAWEVAVFRKDGTEGRTTVVHCWDSPRLVEGGE